MSAKQHSDRCPSRHEVDRKGRRAALRCHRRKHPVGEHTAPVGKGRVNW